MNMGYAEDRDLALLGTATPNRCPNVPGREFERMSWPKQPEIKEVNVFAKGFDHDNDYY